MSSFLLVDCVTFLIAELSFSLLTESGQWTHTHRGRRGEGRVRETGEGQRGRMGEREYGKENRKLSSISLLPKLPEQLRPGQGEGSRLPTQVV